MTVSDRQQFRDLARMRLASRPAAPLALNGCQAAAVLVLLYPKDGVEHLLLTVRTDLVEHHKGQISLPGGAVDDCDQDLEATALRETFEEVGIAPDDVEILGRLDDHAISTRFRLTPIVGALREPPHGFTPSPSEVAEVLEVPVSHLLDPANYIEERRERDGEIVIGPAYEFEGYRIWGATARVLNGFLAILQPA